MREDANVVLCTAILAVVNADFEEVCEHYEEYIGNSGQTLQIRPGTTM
jgi:hypothetical protein